MNSLTINDKFLNKKPLIKWRLFIFLVISLIHLILLLSMLYNIRFTLLFVSELFFFLFYSKAKLKAFIKIMLIATIIFLLNVFFTDGRIITNIGFLKITNDGLLDGIKKAGLFISTIFFTYNCLNKNNDNIIRYYISNTNKNNLLVSSINYFFIFFESIGERYSIKRLWIKLLRIYKNKNVKYKGTMSTLNILSMDFIIYNAIFFVLFISIFISILIVA